jgi:hypothetical protein
MKIIMIVEVPDIAYDEGDVAGFLAKYLAPDVVAGPLGDAVVNEVEAIGFLDGAGDCYGGWKVLPKVAAL